MARAIAPKTATSLADLVPNPKNPRKPWKPEEVARFKASLEQFGDLSGIVRNLTTNQLVGGHKRIETFRSGVRVEVVAEPQPPDKQGTVAHGYVLVDGNRFAYREVRWSLEVETAANLAANRWAAAWEWELVAGALKTIGSDELRAVTGFAEDELANLMASDWTKPEQGKLPGSDVDDHAHSVHLTPQQYELLTAAKFMLDPSGALSDDATIETLCRRLLEPQSP